MIFELPENPYPGLRAFEYPEHFLFFGREGQAQEVAARMQQSHFVAVVGTSGSGKSSLVRAGLLPLLHGGMVHQTGSRWRIGIMRPGEAPIRNLARALVYPENFSSGEPRFQEDETEIAITDSVLRRSGVGILDFFRSKNIADDENLLIVVDQFEEIFRFGDRSGIQDSDEAIAFVKLLLEATNDPNNRIYIIITMRSDFLGDCAEFRDLPEAINRGQYLIPRLTRDQLRSAIESPALVMDAMISPALAGRLLNDLEIEQNQSADLRERMLRDRLPVLQHSLMRTWEEWSKLNTPNEQIEIKHYEDPKVGGMANALSLHADEAFNELSANQQLIAEKIFKSLTDTDFEGRQTRRVTSIRELSAVTETKKEEVIEIINVFRREGRTFLMPPPHFPLNEETRIDISHESLIRNWEYLKTWVREEADDAWQYRKICEDAALYKTDDASLWAGRALELALEWKDRFNPTSAWAARYQSLTEEEQREIAELRRISPANEKARRKEIVESRFQQSMFFIEQSEQEENRVQAEKEGYIRNLQRQRRNLRIAAALSGILMLASMGLAIYAFSMKAAADAAKANAESALTQAKTSEEKEKKASYLAESAKSAAQADADRAKEATNKAEKETARAETATNTAEKEAARADEEKENAQRAEAKEKQQKEIAKDALIKTEEARLGLEASLKNSREKDAQNQDNLSGLISFERGAFEEAEKHFLDLLLDPESLVKKRTNPNAADHPEDTIDWEWWSYHNLGMVYDELDQPVQAEKSFKKALKLLNYPVPDTSAAGAYRLPSFMPVSYQPDSSQNSNESNFYLIAATLRKYGDYFRQRGKNAVGISYSRNPEFCGDANCYNTKAKIIYDDLVKFIDRHGGINRSKVEKKNITQFLAKIEFDLGETFQDLGKSDPRNFELAAKSLKDSYIHYKESGKGDADRITIASRKGWSRATAHRDDLPIQNKEAEIREINRQLLANDPADPDAADVFVDLNVAFTREIGKLMEANKTFLDAFEKSLPPEKLREINNTLFLERDSMGAYASNRPYYGANVAFPYYYGDNTATNSNSNSSVPFKSLESFMSQDQLKEYRKLKKNIGNYQIRASAYRRLSATFTDPQRNFIPESPDYFKINEELLKLVNLASAYFEAHECSNGNKIIDRIFLESRADDPFSRYNLMFYVVLVNADVLADKDKLNEYFNAALTSLDDPNFDTALTKLNSEPEFRLPDNWLRFYTLTSRTFQKLGQYQRAKELSLRFIQKLQNAERTPSNGEDQTSDLMLLADAYSDLARIAEDEADREKDTAKSSAALKEAELFYEEAIKASIPPNIQNRATRINSLNMPDLKYRIDLAAFFERQKDETNLLKIYSDLKDPLEKFLNGKLLKDVIDEFPVTIYTKILKKFGDNAKNANRTREAIEYYSRALKILEFCETDLENMGSLKSDSEVEKVSYFLWGSLTKTFYTDYIEMLESSAVLSGSKNAEKIANLKQLRENAYDSEIEFEQFEPQQRNCTEGWNETDEKSFKK